jgi:hypothetical protein
LFVRDAVARVCGARAWHPTIARRREQCGDGAAPLEPELELGRQRQIVGQVASFRFGVKDVTIVDQVDYVVYNIHGKRKKISGG